MFSITFTIQNDWQQSPASAGFVCPPSMDCLVVSAGNSSNDGVWGLSRTLPTIAWWKSVAVLTLQEPCRETIYSFLEGWERTLGSLCITVSAILNQLEECLHELVRHVLFFFSTFIILTPALTFQRKMRMRL